MGMASQQEASTTYVQLIPRTNNSSWSNHGPTVRRHNICFFQPRVASIGELQEQHWYQDRTSLHQPQRKRDKRRWLTTTRRFLRWLQYVGICVKYCIGQCDWGKCQSNWSCCNCDGRMGIDGCGDIGGCGCFVNMIPGCNRAWEYPKKVLSWLVPLGEPHAAFELGSTW